MKTLKKFIIFLVFLISFSLIFNKPGLGNLEIFHKLETYLRYPPVMHLALSGVLKIFPANPDILFFNNQNAWIASKFLLFAFYLLTWLSLLYLRKVSKLFRRITVLNLSLAYFLSVSVLLPSMALSFFDILAAPFFILSIAFLSRKKHFLFFVFYVLSIGLSWTLVIFLPFMVLSIWNQKSHFYAMAILVISLLILSQPSFNTKISSEVFSYPWLISQPLSYIATNITFGKIVFTFPLALIVFSASLALYFVYLFLRLIDLGKIFPYFFVGVTVFLFLFTKSIVAFMLIFSAVVYFLYIQRLFLKKSLNFTSLLNILPLSFLIFSVFTPNLQIGNLIWLTVLSLLIYMLSPSKLTLTQLFAANLLVFTNFFVFFGTAGKSPVTGNLFETFKSVLALLYLVFCLKNIQKFSFALEDKKYLVWLKKFLIIYLVVINLALIPSQGSPDMVSWAQYAKASVDYPNPFKAQTVIDQRYPPISTVIIGLFANLWNNLVGLPPAAPGYDNVPGVYAFSTKISVFVFYFISVWLMLKFSSSNLTNLLFILGTFSLIVQTQGLADVNIHAIPFLIAAILFLFKKKFLFSGLFAGISISIKWQPIILVPLFLLTVFSLREKFSLSLKKTTIFLVGLMLVPIISWYLVFIQPGGKEAFERSFTYLKHGAPMLSGQALNLNWIVTYVLHIVRPEENASLAHLEGLNRQIPTANAPVIFQGYLFYLTAAAIFIFYWLKQKKNVYNFLSSSLMIFFSHQILNKSAYEKHLFYSVVFMLLLYLVKPTKTNRLFLILFDIMTLMNLGFFYGFTGPKDINRLFFGFDMTVAFAAYYIVIYLWMFWIYLKGKGFNQPGKALQRKVFVLGGDGGKYSSMI